MNPDTRSTLIGRAWLDERGLHIETNSRERADALRARVEDACGDLVRHRAREHADPRAQLPLTGRHEDAIDQASPEAQQIVLEYKNRHYADWVDHPLPALAGRPPREAVRGADGRHEVDTLLKQMEHMEQQMPAESRFDFGRFRRELGLD